MVSCGAEYGGWGGAEERVGLGGEKMSAAQNLNANLELKDAPSASLLDLLRKYNGESYRIHIRRYGTGHDISIFSKSGHDSTRDLVGLHESITKCLGLGTMQRMHLDWRALGVE